MTTASHIAGMNPAARTPHVVHCRFCLFVATHAVNSFEPVKSLEEFEPDEGLDASFLDDTPADTTNTTLTSQQDLSTDS